MRSSCARIAATSAAASGELTVMRTISEPACASSLTCTAVAIASAVSRKYGARVTRVSLAPRNPAGDTALMLASLKGYVKVVDLLLAAGASFEHTGWNPLLYAAFEGQVAVVERLLLPFGLHHIWNVPFFFEIGSFTKASGEVVHGDITPTNGTISEGGGTGGT